MQIWRHCKPRRKSKDIMDIGYEKHLFDKEEVPGLIKLQKPKKSKKTMCFGYIGKTHSFNCLWNMDSKQEYLIVQKSKVNELELCFS